uniref:Uncharacterized protein n=1 Tax=Leersia perrieri TaxID=77586 RepID=A0A0D9W5W7_9ORYZ
MASTRAGRPPLRAWAPASSPAVGFLRARGRRTRLRARPPALSPAAGFLRARGCRTRLRAWPPDSSPHAAVGLVSARGRRTRLRTRPPASSLGERPSDSSPRGAAGLVPSRWTPIRAAPPASSPAAGHHSAAPVAGLTPNSSPSAAAGLIPNSSPVAAMARRPVCGMPVYPLPTTSPPLVLLQWWCHRHPFLIYAHIAARQSFADTAACSSPTPTPAPPPMLRLHRCSSFVQAGAATRSSHPLLKAHRRIAVWRWGEEDRGHVASSSSYVGLVEMLNSTLNDNTMH